MLHFQFQVLTSELAFLGANTTVLHFFSLGVDRPACSFVCIGGCGRLHLSHYRILHSISTLSSIFHACALLSFLLSLVCMCGDRGKCGSRLHVNPFLPVIPYQLPGVRERERCMFPRCPQSDQQISSLRALSSLFATPLLRCYSRYTLVVVQIVSC